MWRLNEVFSCERVMKILGDDETPLLTLQRDFGVYVVNLFSLHQAARVLSLQVNDLRGLLKIFVGKEFHRLSSRCDWR